MSTSWFACGRMAKRAVCSYLLAWLVFSACYTSRPLQSAAPAPETRIFAELSVGGRMELESTIGQNAIAVDGVVSGIHDDGWELRLLHVDHANRRTIRWNGEKVFFPLTALASVRERRLDRTRTALLVGAITVAALLTGRALGIGGFGGENGGPIIPPE